MGLSLTFTINPTNLKNFRSTEKIMFVNSNSTSDYRHKNGLCIAQRKGGNETLVQWSNGDQRWYETEDLDGKVILVNPNQIGGSDNG